MKVTKKQILAYHNPDPRCTYPFTPDPAGYCWSYANHIDGTPGYKKMKQICIGCEMWTESDKEEIKKKRRKVVEDYEAAYQGQKP